MPIIFKNIRRKLAAENKATAYLRYAIGEILLVVIGILLALQVNTWNHQRLDRIKSIGYHQSLISDLDIIIKDAENDSIRANHIQQSISESVGILERKNLTDSTRKILNTALENFYQFVPLTTQLTSSEEMKSSGELGLIYDPKLRNKIARYQVLHSFISKVYDELARKVSNTDFIDPYVRITLKPEASKDSVEYNFQAMAADPKVVNILSRYASDWQTKEIFSGLLASNAKKLKIAVQSELNKIEK